MHFNAGPWASLLRAMPIGRLFLIGFGGLGAAVFGVNFVVHAERGSALRALGPLFATAGGIGVAALLLGIFRLVMLGGPTVRRLSAAALVLGLASGCVAWYSLSVAQPNARGSGSSAAQGDPPEERARSLDEGTAPAT